MQVGIQQRGEGLYPKEAEIAEIAATPNSL